MHTIQNNNLTVTAKGFGAELVSIYSKEHNIEYLWQADKEVWSRHAPVLFPIVGKLQNNSYNFEGKTYSLPQHGFARDMEFELEEKTQNQLVFLLKSTEETLSKYPFDFELRIIYTLEGNTVLVTYEVKNSGTSPMYFSIGAHPGFNSPLKEGEKFNDYFLEFEKEEMLFRYLLSDGLLTGATEPVIVQDRTFRLSRELFEKDALVFKHLKSNKITLRSEKSGHYVEMLFKDFPFYGIWTKPGQDRFLCLEPWNGIADTKGNSSNLTEKEGILSLESGKSFSCSYQLVLG